jgi:Fe-S cluster biogenesis protein NfuA
MTITEPAVTDAIKDLREILQIDGADISVNSVADGVVVMELSVEGASCQECVLQGPQLESMFLTHLQEVLPGIDEVKIIDPRVSASS